MILKIVGADGGEGTPVPIPNTAVKLTCADNTWLVAAREDRKAPTRSKTPTIFRRSFCFVSEIPPEGDAIFALTGERYIY